MAIGYILMCLIFGTTFLAIKVGLGEGIPPLWMASLRFFIASLVILSYCRYKKIEFPKKMKVYLNIAYLGFLMTTIPFAALFWSETHIPSGTASLLVATAPLFIGLLSRMNWAKWTGLGVAMAGLYMVLSPHLKGSGLTAEGLWANGAIVCSEFFFAYGAIKSKQLLSKEFSPQLFNGLQMLFASLLLFALSLAMGEEIGDAGYWTATGIASLLYLAVGASVLASGIYYWLIQKTNPLFPSTWTYVSPVVALAAGAFILKEPFTLLSLAGSLLVISGVVFMNWETLAAAVFKKDGVYAER